MGLIEHIIFAIEGIMCTLCTHTLFVHTHTVSFTVFLVQGITRSLTIIIAGS